MNHSEISNDNSSSPDEPRIDQKSCLTEASCVSLVAKNWRSFLEVEDYLLTDRVLDAVLNDPSFNFKCLSGMAEHPSVRKLCVHALYEKHGRLNDIPDEFLTQPVLLEVIYRKRNFAVYVQTLLTHESWLQVATLASDRAVIVGRIPWFIYSADNPLTVELVDACLNASPKAIPYIPHEHLISDTYIDEAIKKDGLVLSLLQENRRTRARCVAALAGTQEALRSIPAEFLSPPFFLEVLRANPSFPSSAIPKEFINEVVFDALLRRDFGGVVNDNNILRIAEALGSRPSLIKMATNEFHRKKLKRMFRDAQ